MADYYDSQKLLLACESEWKRNIRTIKDQPRLVMAIHGGKLEAGASEIAYKIAGGIYDADAKWNYFVWDALRLDGESGAMHVTSTNYDDPVAEAMAARGSIVLSVHGCADTTAGQPNGSQIVWVGGMNTALRDAIQTALYGVGFDARIASDPSIRGDEATNIVNRTATVNGGVQLEVTKSLRDTFYSVNTIAGRAGSRTVEHTAFCDTIRSIMAA